MPGGDTVEELNSLALIPEYPEKSCVNAELPTELVGEAAATEIVTVPKKVNGWRDRRPNSIGAKLHPEGCKPCAWFWRPCGCENGLDCEHCHACPEGTLKARRKAKQARNRNELKAQKNEEKEQDQQEDYDTRPEEESMLDYKFNYEEVPCAPQDQILVQHGHGWARMPPFPMSSSWEYKSAQDQRLLSPKKVALPSIQDPMSPLQRCYDTPQKVPEDKLQAAANTNATVDNSPGAIVGSFCVTRKQSEDDTASTACPSPHDAGTPGNDPASPESGKPSAKSLGSKNHATQDCKPCAWFHKSQGCQNGYDCRHCHECPFGEIKKRRRAKANTDKAAKGGRKTRLIPDNTFSEVNAGGGEDSSSLSAAYHNESFAEDLENDITAYIPRLASLG